MENVFPHSHPSSPFFPPPSLPHFTQLQLPDAADRERLANGCGVEIGGTVLDQARPRAVLWGKRGGRLVRGGIASDGLESMKPVG